MTTEATQLPRTRLWPELLLLGLLSLLWGSSYLYTKIAVAEIPPLTLTAGRVGIAAVFLIGLLMVRRVSLPTRPATWRRLGIQAFFNSIGAWSLLAWGQQHIDAGLASVLNSTSPLFVFLFTALLTRHEALNGLKLLGTILGFTGVVLIVGTEALDGLGDQVWGQLAALTGAAMYGWAAIYGKRFGDLRPEATAAGTMIWATAILVPAALVLEQPWTLAPSGAALACVGALGILSTGVALLIYFRLVQTLGSLGVASQAYLRAGVGVLLGIVFLSESLELVTAIGMACALAGVIGINRR